MPTIEVFTERAEPVSPDVLGEDILARFEREPDTLVIPVVVDGRPVGLIERNDFTLKMAAAYGRATYAARPIERAMDADPAMVESSTAIDAFCDAMLARRPGDLMRGFIVTRQGRYFGVGTGLSLLQAAHARQEGESAVGKASGAAAPDPRAEAQIAARARSEFLGAMSHELRTPMNGVLAVAELLRRQPLGADAQAYVQTIIDSSETLLRILQDALDLSRAEAGELELTPEPCALRAVMDDIQTVWAPRAAQDRVTLLVGYEGDTELAAEIDPVRLKQVFNNLIGNALKFARNGVVEASLKAWAEGSDVRLEARVRDNGRGVDKARIEEIFQPFVHGAGPDGAGLGLSICRQIVERMSGRIWAEPNAGRGATFAFDLRAPRAHVEIEAESNVSEIAELQLQTQPHVLIVDDNATNRVVAQALCEMFGCTSETAEDGVQAVQAVSERSFDLVLMDIKMPRMDGVEATKTIRGLELPARNVPIIALTANADPDDAKHYLSIGMAAVVEKPIKPERLRQAMNAALVPEAEAAAPRAGRQARSVA